MGDPHRRRVRAAGRILLAGLLAPSACAPGGEAGPANVVTDGLGRRVEIPAAPQRLVSLAPGVTGTLAALGLGGRVVGITDFCDPPAGARRVARVGGMLNPDLEAVAALRPDLLIASSSGNDPALARQAAVLGLPLFVMHTPDIEGTLQAVSGLAAALGEAGRGMALERELRGRLAALRDRVAGRPVPRVLFLVWGDPPVVPGGPAFVTDALRLAGGASVTSDARTAWPAFDLESLLRRSPEVILTVPDGAPMLERLRADAAWAGVPAVRTGRMHVISPAIQQPGPAVVTGIEEVGGLLHPGAGVTTGRPRPDTPGSPDLDP